MPTLIDISNEEIMGMISNSLQLSLKQVSVTLELLNEGNTVPFIARYRKEKTNSLDEIQIRNIEQRYQDDTELIKEKYITEGRRTVPVDLVKKLIADIEHLYGRDSDYLDAILILTAEIAKLKEHIKNLKS